MRIHKYFYSCLVAAISMLALQATAGNINLMTARATANQFLKQHSSNQPGSIKAPALADLKLAHAEPSDVVNGAHAYFIFNIEGGGFIIVAGEDRAAHVLGYCDEGKIDVNEMPEPLQDLLDNYKREIEFLQTCKVNEIRIGSRDLKEFEGGVEPMLKCKYGQDMPYNLECPTKNGKNSKVGCAGVTMLQTCYFWQYPLSCDSLPGYYSSRLGGDVPDLPGATFDYNKMLPSYCHWDWDLSKLVQDTYTDEEAHAVALLARYCTQAATMNYSPDLSTVNPTGKLKGMKTLGFNPNARLVYSTDGYSTEVWESMIKGEIDAGRVVMYASAKPGSVGHAFMIDGYNTEGYFHMNMGWFGACDAWFLTTAIILTTRTGAERDYSSNNNMILNLEPPLYCIFSSGNIDSNSDLIILGDMLETHATQVYLNTSHRIIDLAFALIDADGNQVAGSNPLQMKRYMFEQGCDINSEILLPTTLAEGTYDLQFNCYEGDNLLATAGTAPGKLTVVGRLAKYNGSFDVSDVVNVINIVLNNESVLDVGDITHLIDYILNHC